MRKINSMRRYEVKESYMVGRTHMIVGATSALYLGQILKLPINTLGESITLITLGAVGGLLPDIDHPNSKLGRKIPLLPHLLTHRGFTHTLVFILLTGVLLYYLNLDLVYIYCFLGAMLMHLICDLCTPAGLQIFRIGSLFDKTIRIPVASFSKIFEDIVFLCALFLLLNHLGSLIR